jgi:putative amide transporter protein
MLIGVVLLYVGVVLAVNGLWLIGQALAARQVARARPAVAVATPTYGGGADNPPAGNPVSSEVAAEVAAGQEYGGEPGIEVPRAERSPLYMQNREVAVINIFTGFIGIAAAITLIVSGNSSGSLLSVRAGAFILLFAFTYLWVAFNQFLNAGGRAFGWYCLFVAVTAIPAGIYILQASGGHAGLVWLGVDWFAWSLLWGLFWLLLTFELPIALFTGAIALLEGIFTSWALAIAILEGKLTFL